MKIIDCTDADYAQALQSLYTRPACPPEIEERAKAIVEEVRLHGDKAVLAQIAKFDGVKLTASKLKVSDAEIKAAKAAVPKKTRDAVKHAIAAARPAATRAIALLICILLVSFFQRSQQARPSHLSIQLTVRPQRHDVL